MLTIDQAQLEAAKVFQILVGRLTSPQFYTRIGAIIVAIPVAHFARWQIESRTNYFRSMPEQGALMKIGRRVFNCRDLFSRC